MKKVFGVCVLLLFGFLIPSIAYAGSLNVYEAQIVEAAKKTYEYQGKLYRAEDTYIDQLVAYLSADGVDLTSEERDEVLAIAYSSVESGVSDGYLVPVEQAAPSVSPTVSPSDMSTEEADDTDTEATDTGANGQDVQTDDSDADTSSDATGEDNTAADTSAEDTSTATDDSPDTEVTADGPSAADTTAEEYTSPEELIKGILEEKEAEISSEEASAEQESSIFDSMNNLDDTNHSVIKNTGFDFSSVVYMIVGMGILMLTAIIVTLRSNLFAHEDD